MMDHIAKGRRTRGAAVLLWASTSCSGPGGCTPSHRSGAAPPTPPTPQAGYVGEDDLVARSTLKFGAPRAAARYDRLETCLQRRGEDGFYHYPRRRIGNFVKLEWCRGPGAHINCAGGDTRKGAGVAWTSLAVMHYPQRWPEVFGLSFSVADVPPADGVGVALAWSEGGKRVLGEHFSVAFRRVARGEVTAQTFLGMGVQFEVGLEPIRITETRSAGELYRKARTSPEALRSEIEGRLSALERAVTDALQADTPRKCIYGEYEGDGVPPPCLEEVPLSAEEKADASTRLAERLRRERDFVSAEYATMHQRFVALLPETCWSPDEGNGP
ncbi:MAG: hypothetical protein AAGN82_12765 [Myxococcota bacterium]